MTEEQGETAFLRQCLLYEDTAERHRLDAGLAQIQRDERCVRRAVWLMALLSALAMAGVCYTAVFLTDYPHNVAQFMTQFVIKVFCALGLASLICMLAFVGLGVVYRRELDRRREECRRLATRLLESRLGKPRTTLLPGVVKEQEIVVCHGKMVVSASEIVQLPKSGYGRQPD